MSSGAPSYAELLAGAMPGIDRAAVAAALRRREREPLMLRAFAGFGAWLTALFVVAFLAAAGALDDAPACFVIGSLLLVGGVGLARCAAGPFSSQFALATLFAGDAVLLVGAAQEGGIDAMLIAQIAVGAIAYGPSRNGTFRFLAPLAAIVLATLCVEQASHLAWIHVVILVLALLSGMLFLVDERPAVLDPLANAAALGMAATLLVFDLDYRGRGGVGPNALVASWPNGLLLAALLIASYARIAGGFERLRTPALLLAVVATAVLGAFTHPGLLAAVALVVLGIWHGERVLPVLGVLYLVHALVAYYRSLAVDLATKGWIILASGVLLLLLRPVFTCLARRSMHP